MMTENDSSKANLQAIDAGLQGSVAELVPLGLVPLEPLYEIALRGEAGITWRTRGRTVSLEVFSQSLWDTGTASFAVTSRSTPSALIGFIGLYNVDESSQIASVSAFFDSRVPNSGIVAGDAMRLFCRYVFDVIGLRKLLIETPSGLVDGVTHALKRGNTIVHEGTLERHTRIGGQYHDIELFAIWADTFSERTTGTAVAHRSTPHGLVEAALTELLGELPERPLPGGYRLVQDLGLDSLALAELLDMLEEDAGVLIEPDDLTTELTVFDLIAAIEPGYASATPR